MSTMFPDVLEIPTRTHAHMHKCACVLAFILLPKTTSTFALWRNVKHKHTRTYSTLLCSTMNWLKFWCWHGFVFDMHVIYITVGDDPVKMRCQRVDVINCRNC